MTHFKRKPFWITMAVIAFFGWLLLLELKWSGLWTILAGAGFWWLLILFMESWGSDYEGPDNEMYP